MKLVLVVELHLAFIEILFAGIEKDNALRLEGDDLAAEFGAY